MLWVLSGVVVGLIMVGDLIRPSRMEPERGSRAASQAGRILHQSAVPRFQLLTPDSGNLAYLVIAEGLDI